MNGFLSNIKTIHLILTLAVLSGCGMAGLPFTGQVTDAETGEPIEGAIVVAKWTGNTGVVGSRSVCYHVETAISNKEGKFRIPGWFGGGKIYVMQRGWDTVAYKLGYKEAYSMGIYKNEIRQKGEVKMISFTGSNSEWMEYINKYVISARCLEGDASRKNLFTFFKAIYQESLSAAKAPSDKAILERIRKAAASTGVAAPLDMEGRKADELEKRFIEEHLK